MNNIFIARQPIYNRGLEIYGYELLFRDLNPDFAEITDGDKASSQVIVNTFINIGIENIVGENYAFINLTRNFIVSEHLLPMSPKQVVLEVLEDIYPDEEVVAGLSRLSNKNYTIALDDFVYQSYLDPLLHIANIVKIDLFKSKEHLEQQVEILRKFNVRLLAEKIETQDEYDFCKKLGFDYFQGYYFSRPNIINRKDTLSNKLVVLSLINKLQDPNVSMEELENIIIQDVALSYKLLRYINSATYALRKEVESIKQALVLLGTQTVKNWVTLIVMSTLNSNKPNELMTIALIRAKMGELLSENHGTKIKQQMFTVGLFSILDSLLDVSMVELLDTVSLSKSIKSALLDYSGEMGEILNQVLLYEQGKWNKLDIQSTGALRLSGAYLEAVKWADKSISALY